MEYLTPAELTEWMAFKPDEPRAISANASSAQKEVNMGQNVVFYSEGDTVLIFDTATPIGEEHTIDSIAGTVLTMEDNLANSYTVARSAKVQNRSHWTPRSTPSHASVVDLIEMNEDVLDRDLHTTWKQDGKQTTEYITFLLRQSAPYPYYSFPLRYPFDTQTPMKFRMGGLLPLDPSKGDRLFYVWGAQWMDILDAKNGLTVWESCIDTIVSAESLSAASPITCTLAQSLRLATPLHWKLTHSNITAFSLVITGTKQDGTALVETFTEADLWEGYTAGFYNSITSIVFTRTTGLGTGDTLTVDTEKEASRMSGDYDCWIDYQHSIFYPKNIGIETGHKTAEATYRYSEYFVHGSALPKDVKKMMLYLCGVDILTNERYAVNLPGGGGTDHARIETQIHVWEANYKRMVAKRRKLLVFSGQV